MACSINLSHAFFINAVVSCLFAVMALIPNISTLFWDGLGIPQISPAYASLALSPPICLSLAYLQSLYQNEEKNSEYQFQLARMHLMWWIFIAAALALLTQGGPLVIPLVLGMAILAGTLSVAITLNEPWHVSMKT